MVNVYKLLVFLIIFVSMLLAVCKSFRYLDNKITEGNTGWEILGYSLLLFLVNAILFFGGLFLLVSSYAFLIDAG